MTVSAEQSCASVQQQTSAHLDALAGALERRGMRARMMTPQARVPSLHVVNPAAAALAEDIYAGRSRDGGWLFWWSWAERIGACADVEAAATIIARVLGTRESSTHG